jgi:hypothetical protein
MTLMQRDQRAQQSLAHVRAHRGRRLALAEELRCIKIDSDKLGKGTAEIDEQGEATQGNSSKHLKKHT